MTLGHSHNCRCIACQTYRGQDEANRQAEKRELDVLISTGVAEDARRAEDREHAEQLEAARHRDHEEHMAMLAKVRESNLMRTEEGRSTLAREVREREVAAERVRRHQEAVAERAGKLSEAQARRRAFEERYLDTPHPKAKTPVRPSWKDRSTTTVKLWFAAAVALVVLGSPVVGLISAGVAFAVTGKARKDKRPVSMTPVVLGIASIGAFIAGLGGLFDRTLFVGLLVGIAGIAVGWVLHLRQVRADRLAKASRDLRWRELADAKDKDALIASVLNVDVAAVRIPSNLR